MLGLFSGELIFGGACCWKVFCISKWVGLDNKGGRIFASEIWGANFQESGLIFFFFGGGGGGAYYRNFMVYRKHALQQSDIPM